MLFLLISIVALFAGILVMPLAQKRPTLLALMDGFVLVAIGGLVLFHILPHSIEIAHEWAAGAGIVGLFVPLLFERGAGHRARHAGGNSERTPHAPHKHPDEVPVKGCKKTHNAPRNHPQKDPDYRSEEPDDKTLRNPEKELTHRPGMVIGAFAVLGLGLHALLDGIALALPGDEGLGHEGAGLLVIAVLIHRFPAGLGLSWAMLTEYGLVKTLSAGLFVAVATVLGFVFSGVVVDMTQRPELAVFQAFVAGSLLHVVFAHAPTRQDASRERKTSAVGAILGVALLVALSLDHSSSHGAHDSASTGAVLFALALELAPYLLATMVGAGVLYALAGTSARPRSTAGSWSGTVLQWLPIPPCSCGLTFQYRTWIRAGMPAALAGALMVAVAETGLDTVMISIPVLGPGWTAIRLIVGLLMAFAVALLASKMLETDTDHHHDETACDQHCEERSDPTRIDTSSAWRRLGAGLRYGLADLCDHLMPWILIGFGLAALVAPLVDPEAVARTPVTLQVVLLSFVGIPLRICGSASIPLAAVLLDKGFSLGAVMAFLLAGLTTYGAAGGVVMGHAGHSGHAGRSARGPDAAPRSRRTALFLGGLILLIACGAGVLIDLAAPVFSGPNLQEGAHGPISAFKMVCLILVGCLWLNSFFRCGPRALLAQVVPAYVTPDGHALHDHCRHPDR